MWTFTARVSCTAVSGYTAESLRWIFSELTEIALRRMNDESPDSPRFGESFLWACLFRRGPAIVAE